LDTNTLQLVKTTHLPRQPKRFRSRAVIGPLARLKPWNVIVDIQPLGDVQPHRRASASRARVVISPPAAASAGLHDLDAQSPLLSRQFLAHS